MRRTALIAWIAVTATACATDRSLVEDSLERWDAVTAAHGEHYTYETHGLAGGVPTVTTFEVRDGEVIRRWFWNEPGEHDIEKIVWLESGDDVGSHPEGAAARTIDDIYGDCLAAIEDTAGDRIFAFETDDMGVVTECRVAPDPGCGPADDCDAIPLVELNVHTLQFRP